MDFFKRGISFVTGPSLDEGEPWWPNGQWAGVPGGCSLIWAV